MHLWEICGVIAIVFLLLEIMIPSMFFLNFALAGIICAPLSIWIKNIPALVIIFFILSFVSFFFLRPILVKKFNKDKETGISSKYIGASAIATEDITSNSGVINIYGERWDARSDNGEVIPKGCNVKIVRNESIIMYVIKSE